MANAINNTHPAAAPRPPISFTYKSAMGSRDSAKLPEAVKSCFLRRSASQKEVERFDLQTAIVRSTFTGSVCALCETRYKPNEMEGVADCEHTFCRRCLHEYLVYKINVMEQVTCPQEDCPAELQLTAQCYLDLPEDYRRRYGRFLLWQQTIENPALRLCPGERCEGVIDTREGFTCGKCRTEYCGQCMLVRHRGPCDANFQRNFRDWKRCPSCRIFIEKNEGCNHMTCLCGHQFCFVCLANWHESHYQCGSPVQLQAAHHFAAELPRYKQLLLAFLMILLTPVFVLLTVAALILCIGLAAVAGAVGGPCAVALNTFTRDCCCVWVLLFAVALPIIVVVAAIGVAVKIGYEGVLILCNLFRSYFSTIEVLLWPPEEPEPELFDEPFN